MLVAFRLVAITVCDAHLAYLAEACQLLRYGHRAPPRPRYVSTRARHDGAITVVGAGVRDAYVEQGFSGLSTQALVAVLVVLLLLVAVFVRNLSNNALQHHLQLWNLRPLFQQYCFDSDRPAAIRAYDARGDG